ncbi:MAG: glycoside hydrolase family 44 protein [Candidatus Moduliflexus flocculans]|nr:glycoside hydrolase family 44 protein [Candidatus Moduliflexus flocculans]
MRRFPRIPLLVFAAALALAACQATSAPEPGVDLEVTVSGSTVLRTVEPGLIFGANLGAWVSNTKLGPATQDLFKALRPSIARFPGGNMCNNYCWVEQKVSDNDHVVWNDWSWGIGVDQYIAFLKAVDGVPMFSLNPFDHTIDGESHSAVAEAAALAAKLVAEGFSGAYYEVGNENDGSWNPMLGIEAYTDRFVLLARAVKAVDPSARFLGPVASYPETVEDFLDRLALVGGTGLLDGVSYHHYGGWISNSNTSGIDLGEPQQYSDGLDALRADLASRGLARVKIAVTELNAAIWDTGCTRDQFTIKQGLWLADALGVSLVGADAANVWIHLHPGADPHALIDSDATPPAGTRNYGPVALTAQTLSASDPTEPVEVLPVALGAGPSVLTGYAARKADGTIGVLLVNKSAESFKIALESPAIPRSVTGRVIGPEEYAAAAAPAALPVRIESRRAIFDIPATSIVGLDIR